MTVRRLPPATRRIVGVALGAWVLLLLVTLVSPSAAGPSWLVGTIAGVMDDLGIPPAVTAPERVEFALNVAAFVPVGLLGSVLWPRFNWRDWTAGGFAASFLVEAFQAVALGSRSATYVDVVSNTLGALVGAVLGAAVLRSGWVASEGGADLADRPAPTQQDHLPG